MNTELMAAWNDSSVDGPKWEDLPIVEQHRLEAFTEELVGEDQENTIFELEMALNAAQAELRTCKSELEKAKAAK